MVCVRNGRHSENAERKKEKRDKMPFSPQEIAETHGQQQKKERANYAQKKSLGIVGNELFSIKVELFSQK